MSYSQCLTGIDLIFYVDSIVLALNVEIERISSSIDVAYLIYEAFYIIDAAVNIIVTRL